MAREQHIRKRFFVRIVFPTLLAIVLFIIAMFVIIIPSFERTIMDRKKEMIRELTNSAWSILAEFEREEKAGTYTKEEAQKLAILRIETLRYGIEDKDYFWITDMHPRMIMHPYIPELNGTDLTDYKDPNGKRLFVEFVDVVKKSGHGYVEYSWQWMDDPNHIVPKISYVREFKPWEWIIGTGIYFVRKSGKQIRKGKLMRDESETLIQAPDHPIIASFSLFW